MYLTTAGASVNIKKHDRQRVGVNALEVMTPVISVIGISCNCGGRSCHRHIVDVRPKWPASSSLGYIATGVAMAAIIVGQSHLILLMSDRMVCMVMVIRLGCNWGGYDCHHGWAKSLSHS